MSYQMLASVPPYVLGARQVVFQQLESLLAVILLPGKAEIT